MKINIRKIITYNLIILVTSLLLWITFSNPQTKTRQYVGDIYISQKMKDNIDSVIERQDSIIGIQIVSLNFMNNTRTEVYMSISHPTARAIYDNFLNNTVIQIPLFDSDKNNNDKILRMMEGEFVCVPFIESSAYRYAPIASEFVKGVCGLAIPPYNHGDFSGMLTLYLKNTPTKDEIDTLFLFARELSSDIHNDSNRKNDNKNQLRLGVR